MVFEPTSFAVQWSHHLHHFRPVSAALLARPRRQSPVSNTSVCPALAGVWQNRPSELITLDLSDLPNADGSKTDILTWLDNHEFLDVYINDDTEIDFAKLNVKYCCPIVEMPPATPIGQGRPPNLGITKSAIGEFVFGGKGSFQIDVINNGPGVSKSPRSL